MNENDDKKLDGFISKIKLANGKVYGIKACITEVHPMTCPKCGGNVILKYGHGTCDYCKTSFSTEFKLVAE